MVEENSVIVIDDEKIARFREEFEKVHSEISKVIVGYRDIVDQVLITILARGHCILEGVPGVGKTRLVQTLSRVLDLHSMRVQFTPDLMPADILGTNVVQESPTGEKFLKFQPGPIFANIVLADEINRATPKTQSALLEAMQEKSVTVGNHTYKLDEPFVVLATLNPLELEATYPLPEAQVDRFLMKLRMEFPDSDSIHEILDRTTRSEEPVVRPVWGGAKILELRELALSVPNSERVQDYAIRIVMATQPSTEYATEMTGKYLRYGASPRGSQALVVGGKIRALLAGRREAAFEDVRSIVHPALRHRIILNFEGEAERIDPDNILEDILERTKE
jgi:MoxR-like ATPase